MKNKSFLIPVIAVAIGFAAGYLLCNTIECSERSKCETVVSSKPTGSIVPVPAIPPCPSCCPGNCYPVICDITPRFDLELAKEMIHNYRVHHWETINKYCPSIINQNLYQPASLYNNNKVDSRSVWFSLADLKRFINTVETKTCANAPSTCPAKPELGVRFYFAEYPTTSDKLPTDISPEYAGMQTLLLIPTYESDGINIDFDPEQLDGATCLANSVFDSAALVGSTITALAAKNHGSLAPPPFYCNGSSISSGGSGTGNDVDGYWYSGANFMMYVDKFRDCYFSPNGNASNCTTIFPECPPTGRP